jgi:hypothetical protein
MDSCLTKFADLPQAAQDALREKFLNEAHDWLLANLIEP